MDRRHLLKLMAAAPIAGLGVACGVASDSKPGESVSGASPEEGSSRLASIETQQTPSPKSEPYVIPRGDERYTLMTGTRYETSLYVFGSGEPGPIAMVLGGVHGDEPGGWLGAERVVDTLRPRNGAILVIPRANRVATLSGVRTTDEMGDINRSYPGFDDGKPMERMAFEIVNAVRWYHVDLVHDMHESWAFYKDRATNGTAYIGQTIASSGQEGLAFAARLVDKINTQIQSSQEEFFSRDLAMPQPNNNLPRQTTNVPAPGRGTSSLSFNRFVPGVIPILVEMGQQQSMERRTALHFQLFEDALAELGLATV